MGAADGGGDFKVGAAFAGLYAEDGLDVAGEVELPGVVGVVVANLDGLSVARDGDLRAVV